MRKSVKIPLLIFLSIISAAVVVVLFILTSGFFTIQDNLNFQHENLASLVETYSSPDFTPVNEQDFCDFDLSQALEDGTSLADIQYLSSHNAYKREKSTSEKIYSLFSEGLREGNYFNDTITEQLNSGIRALEIDLFNQKVRNETKFRSFHISYLDMSSNAYDFEMFLDEINLWSQNNPGHLPVIVYIELKTKGVVSPFRKWGGGELLDDFDKLVKSKIADLYTPLEASKSYSCFEDRIKNESLPLSEVMGKVIFSANGPNDWSTFVSNNKEHVLFNYKPYFYNGFYEDVINTPAQANLMTVKTHNLPSKRNAKVDWLTSEGKTVILRPKKSA